MVPHLLSPSSARRRRRTEFRIASRRRDVSRIIIKRKNCRHQRSDWSNIDCDILEHIQRKSHFADVLWCRTVCSRWRSLTRSHISPSLNSPAAQLPPLVLWYNRFFDVSRPEKQYYLHRKSNHHLLLEKLGFCVGFNHGWFLFLDKEKENTLCLFHPLLFCAAAVCFPPIVTPEGFYPILRPILGNDDFLKVVLWADPILRYGNYGIAAVDLFYKKILFAKAGATQFTNVEYHYSKQLGCRDKKDIICFKNRIYGVFLTIDGQHRMEAWDCTGPCDSPTKVLDFEPEFSSLNGLSSTSTIHLVESQGELLLVSIQRPDRQKMLHIYRKRTMHFPSLFALVRSHNVVRVYKMDLQQRKWVRMDSLGDCALFILENRNLSVSTIEFPQFKRNTVYFKHQVFAGSLVVNCIGVFNMEDGPMEEIYGLHGTDRFHMVRNKLT